MTTWYKRWDSNNDGKLTRRDFELLAERLLKVYLYLLVGM